MTRIITKSQLKQIILQEIGSALHRVSPTDWPKKVKAKTEPSRARFSNEQESDLKKRLENIKRHVASKDYVDEYGEISAEDLKELLRQAAIDIKKFYEDCIKKCAQSPGCDQHEAIVSCMETASTHERYARYYHRLPWFQKVLEDIGVIFGEVILSPVTGTYAVAKKLTKLLTAENKISEDVSEFGENELEEELTEVEGQPTPEELLKRLNGATSGLNKK